MRKIYPTELIDFQQCRHMAFLKKSGVQGEEKLSEEIELLRKKGLEHEEEFLNSLEGDVVKIDADIPREEQSRLTRDAMSSGKDYIYQAYLENDHLAGYPDFLEKVHTPSDFGDYAYQILDTKLANHPTAANAVQLIHYSEITEEIQGKGTSELYVVHGNKSRSRISKENFYAYYKELLSEFEAFINGDEKTEPFPISYCKSCSYQTHCSTYWSEYDHLAGLNSIKQADLQKLESDGLDSMATLAKSTWSDALSLSRNHFSELQMQAKAQKEGEVHLKDYSSFLALKSISSAGVLLNIYRRINSQDSIAFYMSLKTLGGERFEELFIDTVEDESKALQRIVSFVMRYLDKKPNSFLLLWSNADIKLINDLSNRYNVCHEDLDYLLFNNKIISIQSILQSSFYLPSHENSLIAVYEMLKEKDEIFESLGKSPQILNELRQSGGVEKVEEMITNRAKSELLALEAIIKNFAEYEKSSFPLKILNTEESS